MPAQRVPSKTETRDLFHRLRETHDPTAREALILSHQRLAIYLARKFADRGEPVDDIVQVARIGLIKAVDRYDPSRGMEFTTYATPTILGEIKRYFRDKLWPLHVPRRLRELNYTLMRSVEELSQRFGRSPTISELAEETGTPFDAVIEALEAGKGYSAVSLEAEVAEENSSERLMPLGEVVGDRDASLERFEDRDALQWAIGRLPDRLREIIQLRFYDRLSQAEIGRRLGISQMHVSRQLREALARLRSLIAG